MAKKPTETIKPSLKDSTKDTIIEAQKEKITALTDYSKKLKKELKECKNAYNSECDHIEELFQAELKLEKHKSDIKLTFCIAGSLLLGILIGLLL